MKPTAAAVLKTLLNIFGAFAVGYGGAIASGQPPKVAAVTGAIAAVTNQAALHQDPPKTS